MLLSLYGTWNTVMCKKCKRYSEAEFRALLPRNFVENLSDFRKDWDHLITKVSSSTKVLSGENSRKQNLAEIRCLEVKLKKTCPIGNASPEPYSSKSARRAWGGNYSALHHTARHQSPCGWAVRASECWFEEFNSQPRIPIFFFSGGYNFRNKLKWKMLCFA